MRFSALTFFIFRLQDSNFVNEDSINQSIYDSLLKTLPDTYQPHKDGQEMGGIFVGAIVSIIFGSFFLYNFINSRYWERGIVPPFMRGTGGNKYEAVLNISVNIFLSNRENYIDKQRMLQQFLYREFPDVKGNMNDSVKGALSQRLQVRSAADWLFKKTTQEERERYLRFFFESASLDGFINTREEKYLKIISASFKLDEMKLRSWIDENRRKFAEQQQKENSRKQESTIRTSAYSREKFAKILGVHSTANAIEIKKAYRKLAMTHHPDKFQNASKEAREEAHEKFMEIQEAYEYFVDFQTA